MQTSESIASLAAALSKAQGEFTNPPRNREVTVRSDKGNYKFAYATFDAIIDTVRPSLAKHGLSYIQSVASAEEGGGVIVTTRLMHSSGEWIEDSIGGRAEKAGLQAVGSVLTYLKRYALTALLGVASDEDDDGNSAEGNSIDKADRARKAAPPQRSAPADDDPAKAEARAHWARISTALKGVQSKADLDGIFAAEGKALGLIKAANEDAYAKLITAANELEDRFAKEAA